MKKRYDTIQLISIGKHEEYCSVVKGFTYR